MGKGSRSPKNVKSAVKEGEKEKTKKKKNKKKKNKRKIFSIFLRVHCSGRYN
jgi:hypothetical protein